MKSISLILALLLSNTIAAPAGNTYVALEARDEAAVLNAVLKGTEARRTADVNLLPLEGKRAEEGVLISIAAREAAAAQNANVVCGILDAVGKLLSDVSDQLDLDISASIDTDVLLGGLTGTVGNVGGAVTGVAGGLLNAVGGLLDGLLGGLLGGGKSKVNQSQIVDGLSTVVNGLNKGGLGDAVTSALGNAANLGTIASGVDTAVSNLGTTAGNLQTAAGNIGNTATNAVSGLGSGGGNLGNTAGSLGTAVNNLGTTAGSLLGGGKTGSGTTGAPVDLANLGTLLSGAGKTGSGTTGTPADLANLGTLLSGASKSGSGTGDLGNLASLTSLGSLLNGGKTGSGKTGTSGDLGNLASLGALGSLLSGSSSTQSIGTNSGFLSGLKNSLGGPGGLDIFNNALTSAATNGKKIDVPALASVLGGGHCFCTPSKRDDFEERDVSESVSFESAPTKRSENAAVLDVVSKLMTAAAGDNKELQAAARKVAEAVNTFHKVAEQKQAAKAAKA
ncbi:hypothetical protein G7Z17_g2968 [Cylindrodendrum hubeiense]|uniref:Uncharacterized protein n=1 Tax=Cylindrodendrum hubeiense TaxID=595255 RepID=A0A9P5HHU3_9HYPO|nr:hypothetical protein G7Z17_g2968 [Cylindrodendrum hubeiense]